MTQTFLSCLKNNPQPLKIFTKPIFHRNRQTETWEAERALREMSYGAGSAKEGKLIISEQRQVSELWRHVMCRIILDIDNSLHTTSEIYEVSSPSTGTESTRLKGARQQRSGITGQRLSPRSATGVSG